MSACPEVGLDLSRAVHNPGSTVDKFGHIIPWAPEGLLAA